MLHRSTDAGAMILRLMVVLTLLACPRAGGAQGNWSVIATYGAALGQVKGPNALAVDTAGNLYVADWGNGRIQKRDIRGNWSILALYGDATGQVTGPYALAVDALSNLYVVDWVAADVPRIQKRDAQGSWSVIDTSGTSLQFYWAAGGLVSSLAVDAADNLYVADHHNADYLVEYPASSYIWKRDAQGNWSMITDFVNDPGQGDYYYLSALAVDPARSLYVADSVNSIGVQKRDALGNWSVIAAEGDALGQVDDPAALAVDAADNLYVAEHGDNGQGDLGPRIQKRDAHGNWLAIPAASSALGQVGLANGIPVAADAAGNLYVANTRESRVLMYTPHSSQ